MKIIPKSPFTFPSVLKEIREIEEGGIFLDSTKPVGRNEQVLGEMNTEEKAVFTIINGLEKEYLAKAARLEEMKKREIYPMDELIGQVDLSVNLGRIFSLLGLLSMLVNDRLGWEETGSVVDFRQGFLVVAEEEEESSNKSDRLVLKTKIDYL